MITRIVKLSIRTDLVKSFQSLFEDSKSGILSFPGCQMVDLLKTDSKDNVTIFFTYSIWSSDSDLEHYRHSEYFKNVWKATKAHFAGKPEAWTTKKVG